MLVNWQMRIRISDTLLRSTVKSRWKHEMQLDSTSTYRYSYTPPPHVRHIQTTPLRIASQPNALTANPPSYRAFA
jgi:hypothetical protein